MAEVAERLGRRFDYLRDPQAISRESFARIRAATDFEHLPEKLHPLALRLVHACGMPDIVADLRFAGDPIAAARDALAQGAPVLCDCEMVRAGIAARHLPAASALLCTLHDPRVVGLARQLETTRSAAAVELWRPHLERAVVAIGSAPTALFHLLERLLNGWPRPAVIFAFPVGFVGAAESKQALCEADCGVPFVTVCGRRGGSALAAAAINAVLLGDARA